MSFLSIYSANSSYCSVLVFKHDQAAISATKQVEESDHEVKETVSDTGVAPLDFSFLHLTTVEGRRFY